MIVALLLALVVGYLLAVILIGMIRFGVVFLALAAAVVLSLVSLLARPSGRSSDG